ncbi:pentatricopeptide repeat-containing protein Pet309p, mitochondrial [Monosporozyma servazzii]
MEKYGLSLIQTCNRRLIVVPAANYFAYCNSSRRSFSDIPSQNYINASHKGSNVLVPNVNRLKPQDINNPMERYQMMKNLINDDKFSQIIAIGDNLLLEQDVNKQRIRWKPDVSLKEYYWYFHSLIKTKQWHIVDKMMLQMIAQFSISNRRKVLLLLASTLRHMLASTLSKRDRALLIENLLFWAHWIKKMNGTCELLDFMREQPLLLPISRLIRSKNFLTEKDPINVFLNEVLIRVKDEMGPSAASQLSSTFMNLLNRDAGLKEVEKIWEFKVENSLPIISNDLTVLLKSYVFQHKYKEIQDVYQLYPHAHGDTIQFDYLLLSHTRLQQWSSLKTQFDDLFGIGKLPNVNHYEIVIFAMAYEKELEKVEMLYGQFLRRKMLPTYSILQSLLYVHYKCNRFLSCFQQFQLFEKYNIEPSESTYLIMFKVYKELNNMEGALKLLRDITDKNPSIVNEEMCSTMIQQCAKVTNYSIAEEIFDIMNNYYNIKPTPLSVSSLMTVYNSSKKFDLTLKLFEKYSKNLEKHDKLIWMYEKAIDAYISLGKYEECTKLVMKMDEISTFDRKSYYQTVLKYEIEVKDDIDKATELLKDMIANGDVEPRHIEQFMRKYDNIHGYNSTLALYDMMIAAKIPLNSKILYYIIKSTFQLQMATGKDLTGTIELLEDIMENIANGNIKLVNGSQLHPSVFGWPIRVIAKDYNPKTAMALLNKYNELFYDKDDKSFKLNNKLINLRSLIVIFGELNKTDEVNYFFQQLCSQLNKFRESTYTTVRNSKLDTILNGIIEYKLVQLEQDGKVAIELPSLLKKFLQQNVIFTNHAWNRIVLSLIKEPKTLEIGMKYINEKLLHGFNIIHKARLLRKNQNNLNRDENDDNKEKSWSLTSKRMNFDYDVPSLYLYSDNYIELFHVIDTKLNGMSFEEYNQLIINEWFSMYPHIMKDYLIQNHSTTVHDWDKFETVNKDILKEIRQQKRATVIKAYKSK